VSSRSCVRAHARSLRYPMDGVERDAPGNEPCIIPAGKVKIQHQHNRWSKTLALSTQCRYK
jgi:hypothetical protein